MEEDIHCNFANGYQGVNAILQISVENSYFYSKSDFYARQRNYLRVEGSYTNNRTYTSLYVNDDLCLAQNWGRTYGGIILLFAMGNGSNVYSGSIKASILYSAKITVDGVLERDFVPCYRKSDDEIGMYDLVNDIFYTNQGTGTFTKGPEVWI